MPSDPGMKMQENLTKVGLTVLFLGIIGLLGYWVERNAAWVKIRELSTFDFILLGLATFRLGRMIAFDRIMDPFRAPFTKVVDDNSGEGKTVVPRGKGFLQAFGQLISCPICVGTWLSAFLVGLMLIVPDATRIFLYIIGAAAVAEVVHSFTEALCWFARSSRTASGLTIQQRKKWMESNESQNAHSHNSTLG